MDIRGEEVKLDPAEQAVLNEERPVHPFAYIKAELPRRLSANEICMAYVNRQLGLENSSNIQLREEASQKLKELLSRQETLENMVAQIFTHEVEML